MNLIWLVLALTLSLNINAYFRDKETVYPIVLHDEEPEEISIDSFVWSSDGKFIAVTYFSNPNTCKIFDFSGKLKFSLNANEAMSSIAWSSDNKYLAIGYIDGIIEIRSAEKEYQVDHVFLCQGTIKLLSWNPNKKNLAVYSKNMTGETPQSNSEKKNNYSDPSFVNIFDVPSMSHKSLIELELEHNIIAMQWNQTGDFLAVGQNARGFSTKKNVVKMGLPQGKLDILHIDFKHLENSKTLISVELKNSLSSLTWIAGSQFRLALSINDFSSNKSIEIYDLLDIHNPKMINDYEFANFSGQITCSPDGSYLALSGLDRIKIYNLKTLSKDSTVDLYNNFTLYNDSAQKFQNPFTAHLDPSMMEYHDYLSRSCYSSSIENVDTTFLVDKISWSPKEPFLAVMAREKSANGNYCHILLILNVSNLYFSTQKILQREIGKLI